MTQPTDHRALRAQMVPTIPDWLVAHIDRVVALAGELARRFDLDEPRTLLAAQGHDVLRHLSDDEWLALAEQRGLDVLDVERAQPVLLHGPLGALELAERYGIEDRDVLDAVRYHTTGHPSYTPEAWAMFVADKVEPHKLARDPGLQRVVGAAERSLERAALVYLDHQAARAAAEGWDVHPLAVATRTYLDAKLTDPTPST